MLKAITIRVSLLTGLILLIAGAFVFATVGLADLTDGLVGYWNFDENSGTIAHDQSTYHNDGTLYGPTWTSGQVGSALAFTSSEHDYVYMGSPAILDMDTALSICAWIMPTGPSSPPQNGGIIVNKEGEYEIARFPDGTIRFAIQITSPNWTWVNTGYVPPLNDWTYLVWTYSSSAHVLKLYVNGSLYDSTSGSGTIGNHYGGLYKQFWVGGRQAPAEVQWYAGKIDEVRAYYRSLSDAEIQELYNNPGGNQQLTAIIDNISPNPAVEGQPVTFSGHGVDTVGYIVGYNWRSSIDGQLSTQASFTTSALSVGRHSIYFKVRDVDSAWSQEVSEILEIMSIANSMTVGALTIRAHNFVDLGNGYFRASGYVWIGNQNGQKVYLYLGVESQVTFNINTGTIISVNYTNVKLSSLGITYTIDNIVSLMIDAQAGRVSFSGKVHYASDAIFQSSFSGACTLEVNQHEFYGRIQFDDSFFGSGTVGMHVGSWDLDGCPFMGISEDVNLTTPVVFTDLTLISGNITIGVFPNTGIFRIGMTNSALEFKESGGAFGFDITGFAAPPGVPSQGMIDVDLAHLRVNVVKDIPIGLWEFKKEDSSEVRLSALNSKRLRTDWSSLRKIGENKYSVDVYDEEGNKYQKFLLDIGLTIKGEEDYTDLNCNGRYDPGEPYVDDNHNGIWDEGTNIQLLDDFQNPIFNAYGHVTVDLTLVSYVHFTIAEATLNIDYPNNTRIDLVAWRGVKLGNIFDVDLFNGELHLDYDAQEFSGTGTLKLGVFSGVEINGDLLIALDPTIFSLDMTGNYQLLGVNFIATGTTMYLSQDSTVGFYSTCFLNAFDLLAAEAAYGVRENSVYGSFNSGFSIDGWHLAQLENRFLFSPAQCMTGVANGELCPIPGGCIGVNLSYRICSFWDWWIAINGVYVRLACPANLHIYDSQGRHTGLNQSGGIDLQIPGSEFYFSQDSSMQLIFIPGFDLDAYTIEVEGESSGVINLDVLYPNTFDSKVHDFTFFNEPTQQGALHRVVLDSTNNLTMLNDLNGDSIFESQSGPDSTAEANLDTTMVIITGVSSKILCANEAEITWNTNVPATSKVLYRSEHDSVYKIVSDTTPTTSHSVIVDNILTTETYYYIVFSVDTSGNIASFLEKNIKLEYIVGDVTRDGVIDIGDVVYLINYLFKGSTAPSPIQRGDCNCDQTVDVGDVVYLINYLFKQGQAPCK